MNVLRGVMARYNYHLQANPVISRCLTAGVIMGSGDALSQSLQRHEPGWRFDYGRCFRYSLFGVLFFTPIQYQVYKIMDRVIPGAGRIVAVKKTFADQVIWAPFSMTYFFVGLGALEGAPWNEISERLQQNFIPSLEAMYMVWPAAQFINFLYIPAQYRILFINFIALGWNVYISGVLAGKGEKKSIEDLR
eukprot:TRINITY_DN15270_c0_g1::TRINITY_DN15270_c0_g1_i1::g.30793::m.30793 TRINITY_DN15270_c0_g1::TRINITY_DN15270_c0_g1_i1::g.30793  ORF type:complete len:191 (-),score=0.94,sp/Q66GV0/MPV17_XENLA/34.50/2e-26,Mpv17_PMP22/PF04117.7/5.5e+03,Mpv17_PMP22/PF04117.7/1.9e+03,Mpv17_PMP22/PF04117.7/1e-24 TRINITY_DN15270_c0_g1_i1:280-852(-)